MRTEQLTKTFETTEETEVEGLHVLSISALVACFTSCMCKIYLAKFPSCAYLVKRMLSVYNVCLQTYL